MVIAMEGCSFAMLDSILLGMFVSYALLPIPCVLELAILIDVKMDFLKKQLDIALLVPQTLIVQVVFLLVK